MNAVGVLKLQWNIFKLLSVLPYLRLLPFLPYFSYTTFETISSEYPLPFIHLFLYISREIAALERASGVFRICNWSQGNSLSQIIILHGSTVKNFLFFWSIYCEVLYALVFLSLPVSSFQNLKNKTYVSTFAPDLCTDMKPGMSFQEETCIESAREHTVIYGPYSNHIGGIAIAILDIFHRSIFYLKHDISVTGFCLIFKWNLFSWAQ
jgi:hypothetical protein